MLSKSERFEFVQNYSNEFPIRILASLVGVSRAGYYKWKNSSRRIDKHEEDLLLKELIEKILKDNFYIYGVRRIKRDLLKEYGLVVNHKCIIRIMRKFNLKCKIRVKRFKRVFQPHGTIPNILNRDFKAEKPLSKLAMDITYMKVTYPRTTWTYLCAIKDLYNNEIVAYTYGKNNDMNIVFQTIAQLKNLNLAKDVILHTDQGFQFTNNKYIKKVAKMGIIQSMSRRGNCWDNACIENFFSHLKTEMPLMSQPRTFEEVEISIFNYIDYYNLKRIQNKYGMSPIEYRLHANI